MDEAPHWGMAICLWLGALLSYGPFDSVQPYRYLLALALQTTLLWRIS